MNRDLLEHRNAADTLLGTAPADLIEPFEAPPSTLDEARKRAEQIRAGLVSYVETRAAIAEAWARRDWRTLGYESWEEYLGAEFGEELRRLAGDERREAVAELRQHKMSTRAIGATLGASEATVRRDLAAAPGEAPATITGSDGKTYPARKPATGAERLDQSEPLPGSTWRHRKFGRHAVVLELTADEVLAKQSSRTTRSKRATWHQYWQLEASAPAQQDTTDSPAGPATPPSTPQVEVADGDPQPPDRPGEPAPAVIGHEAAAPPAATPAAEVDTPVQAPAAGDNLWSATDVAADGTLLEGLDPGAEVYDYGTIAVAGLDVSVQAGRLTADDVPMVFLGGVDEQLLALSMLQVELLIRKLTAAHAQIQQMATADPIVWVAVRRRGIEFHAVEPVPNDHVTRCRRFTSSGTMLPRSQAIAAFQARPCKRCWPPTSGD